MHDNVPAVLPTRTEILRHWLNSDRRPLGSPLTDQTADARVTVQHLIGEVKVAIDRAKDVLASTYDETAA